MQLHTTVAIQMIVAVPNLCRSLYVPGCLLSRLPALNRRPFNGSCPSDLIFPSSLRRTHTKLSVLLSQLHRFPIRPLSISFQAFRLSPALLTIQPPSKIPLAVWNYVEEYFFVSLWRSSGLAANSHL